MTHSTEGCVDKTRMLQEEKLKAELPQKLFKIAGPISNGIRLQNESAARHAGGKFGVVSYPYSFHMFEVERRRL